ncbi:hypothetical protein [Cytobacillus oceanisediminis]|uniref:hypothetical protein n=1 Tax=Cytobacillus oceanisediminis TaxID=665099 RepID=UPI002814A3A4|nr:hypothetical protein [Cytobacillus oceanisediminis]
MQRRHIIFVDHFCHFGKRDCTDYCGSGTRLQKRNYLETLKIIPFMWVIVVLLVRLVAGQLAGRIMQRFSGQTDGFNARILLNTSLNVTILSIFLTILGTWVGSKQISLEPFRNFFHSWLRNFGVAFWIELLIARPIARLAMK